MQEMGQNVATATPQAATQAVRNIGNQVSDQANAENKAQSFAAERMSEVLYANESGAALMALNSKMQSPEKGKFLNDIATGKALAAGLNPDLGSEAAEKTRYVK